MDWDVIIHTAPNTGLNNRITVLLLLSFFFFIYDLEYVFFHRNPRLLGIYLILDHALNIVIHLTTVFLVTNPPYNMSTGSGVFSICFWGGSHFYEKYMKV